MSEQLKSAIVFRIAAHDCDDAQSPPMTRKQLMEMVAVIDQLTAAHARIEELTEAIQSVLTYGALPERYVDELRKAIGDE